MLDVARLVTETMAMESGTPKKMESKDMKGITAAFVKSLAVLRVWPRFRLACRRGRKMPASASCVPDATCLFQVKRRTASALAAAHIAREARQALTVR